ncbi:UDP-N-acetylmuramoylalanyl-D-glutamyl-2,6-diaminopimelate--D-alanyl-D-alanine ligase [Ancylobacter terrae]|uniref:UDP-N-acetylmuramoylalanyl-D-glutamyl-2, 6-diaminopimelate--D-alanyl-D-alanine ligase n=1 Tax=Ancylobacter sp. sgz301288 TaxID=3342077 RepID=UPI00385A2685
MADASAPAPLWTPGELADATGGTITGLPSAGLTGVSIDSRTIAPDEVFFAIKGERVDGHDYVAAALERGAGLAVVARERLLEMPEAAPLLTVDDVLGALEEAGRAARARSSATIVAVTGSVGKTTTKEALRLALGADGETHASAASFNNHWGVPLSLARLPVSARYGVFELGMNHAGEITRLVDFVRPHIAIITAIEAAHFAEFASLAEIADAKAEIFTGVTPGGAAVLNADNAQFARLAAAARAAGIATIVGFGEAADAQVRLVEVDLGPDGAIATADVLGEAVRFTTRLPGRHIVQNALAVLAAAKLAGADLGRAAEALGHLGAPPGRGVRVRLVINGGEALLIDESYNANPASMRAALAVLGGARVEGRGRRLAVLGDMLELGATAAELHRDLAGPVTAQADLVFCAGPLMRELWEALPDERRGSWAPDAAALLPAVAGALRAGDAVMVKGSNGSRMGPLARALAEQFPARDAAARG